MTFKGYSLKIYCVRMVIIMTEKICCFCGHRNIISDNLQEKTESVLIELIETKGYNTFFSGHMGEFDKLCETVIIRLKKKYPQIKLCRISAYYRHNIDKEFFDEIIIPDLGNIHYKRAIGARNNWMAQKADLLLCYVYKDYGGAYDMKKYAEKNGTEIINLY